MAHQNRDIRITSINTQGLKSNTEYITSLLNTNDIIFVCEHWLSNAEKTIVNNLTFRHALYFTPAEKGPTGRPFGGNCFLVSKEFTNVKILHEDSNILTIQLTANNMNMIIIGVYLTCYHDRSTIEKYSTQLNTLSAIIKMYMDEGEIMIVGDYQTFPSIIYDNASRNSLKRNPLSPLLHSFIEEHNLELIDVTRGTGPTYTYQHKTLPNQSYVDHVSVLRETSLTISSCTIYPLEANNMSDHQPLTTTLQTSDNISINSIVHDDISKHGNLIPKSCWKRLDFIESYQKHLSNKLTECLNDCEFLHDVFLESARAAHQETVKTPKAPFSKCWWTPELTACKRILSQHFNKWRDEGFPRETDNIPFNCYQLARKNFRKAIKAAQNKIIFTKYMQINSLRRTNPRKFWTNMRKLKDTNQRRPFIINNKLDDKDITQEFADHFNTLLNIPRTAITQNPRPLPVDHGEPLQVDTNDVRTAIDSLKKDKACDTLGISAEHLIHAENECLFLYLRDMYATIFLEGDTPECLSRTTLLPFVKSYKKSLRSPNNYRGISLIPILTKILEYIILQKCPELAASHTSQFGFKTFSSTQHAEFLISETIRHYNSNGSNVYLCSLDAEKAFDSCNWDILFEKLYYEKSIPLQIVKVLKSLYTKGTYQVSYNGNTSYSFKATQGVFQGSILSPHLYNIYTEALLTNISNCTDAGTTLHGCFTGIVAYADDVILISPTVTGLRKLLGRCQEYFGSTAITLNVAKTEFISSGETKSTPKNAYIPLDGYHVHLQTSLKHLGFLWNVKKSGKASLGDKNVSDRISKFWAVVYSLIKGGIRYCNPETITELYKTLAVPTLTYGLELCSLTQHQLDDLDKEGRKAIKQLFNVSKHSRNYLHKLLSLTPISTTISNNKLNLMTRLLKHDTTKSVVLSILSQPSGVAHKSFVQDVLNVVDSTDNNNFYNILLSQTFTRLPVIYDDMLENIEQQLQDCLNNWNIGAKRKEFTTIMEERVPARLDA